MFADSASPASLPRRRVVSTGGVRSSSALYGRFLQADPIGYGDGMNMYAYVGGDPVNMSDPSGTLQAPTGSRIARSDGSSGGICGSCSGSSARGGGGGGSKDVARTGADYHYQEGHYVGGARDGQLAYRTLTGVTGHYGDLASLSIRGLGQERGGGRFQCSGQYQCGDDESLLRTVYPLYSNRVFLNALVYIQQQARRTGNEWGFTGTGFANFRLVGGYIQGDYRHIDPAIIAQRASMGATIYFHVHPNVGGKFRPWLSAGYQYWYRGGDLGIAYQNSMIVGAYAFENHLFYWFDGRNMRQ